MTGKRQYNSITWLRAIACLFIINTHISCLYPDKISFLAMGGFFGNCIFFLVSGFCLEKPKERFDKWYAHRFIRIYVPYILCLPLLYFAGKLSGLTWYQVLLPYKDYHFLPSILALYPVFYLLSYIDQKTKFKYRWQAIAIFAIQLLQYLVVFDYKSKSVLTHFSFPETSTYLLIMILGGMICQSMTKLSESNKSGKLNGGGTCSVHSFRFCCM